MNAATEPATRGVHHVALLDRIRIQDQLSSANFPFFGGVLLARRGTKLYQSA